MFLSLLAGFQVALITLSYHAAKLVLRVFEGDPGDPIWRVDNFNRRVAVLLFTRDDWRDGIAQQALEAIRPIDHLFICDDSQTDDFREQIDSFAALTHRQCTLIRRDNLEGFKAGNINHALAHIDSCFEFLLFLDHDTRIGAELVQTGVNALCSVPHPPFVQFPLIDDPCQPSLFSNDLRVSLRIGHWFHSLRIRHGLPVFVGRAAMLRKEAVQAIGGFPETITEDIGLTLRLLGAGLTGRYVSTPAAEETVPQDYQRFRSRYVRWCTGTALSWAQRETRPPVSMILSAIGVDGLLQLSSLLYPMVVLCFGLAYSLHASLTDRDSSASSFLQYTTLIAMLAPSIPTFFVLRHPWNSLRVSAIQFAVYLSLVVPCIVALGSIVLGHRVTFVNSGNKAAKPAAGSPSEENQPLSANGIGTMFIEALVFISITLSLGSNGQFGLPLAAGILSGLVFHFFSWSHPIASIFKFLPFALALICLGRVVSF